MNVWTGGTFDLLHPGHIHLLHECAKRGRVTVAVNTDEFVAQFKDPPVQSLGERLTMVGAVRFVHKVQVNPGGKEQARLILEAHTNLIVVGDDWEDRDYAGQLGVTNDWLANHGLRVEYFPRIPGYSSSDLKAVIRG